MSEHPGGPSVSRRGPRATHGPAFHPTLDAVIAWALLLTGAATVAVATWLAYRTPEALGRAVRDPLTVQATTANWTGLVAADLMVLQVLALARLPWLERTWGRARLVRWHAGLAWASWWLVVLHVLLFVAQRVARRPDRVGDQLLDLFVREQHMLVATLGTIALAVVMATSWSRIRPWLRYERWHLLHLWSYAGLGLALPHQLVSPDFTAAGTRAYWWALCLVALAAVVWFRLVVPLAVTVRHRLRVVSVEAEAAGAVSVVMSGRRLDRLRARAGQFLVWRFGGSAGPGPTRGHPYSLSRAPDGQTLRITVGGAGDGARGVAALHPGARVAVEGPYGDLAPLQRRHPHLLLLAAGVGVTPFRALLEEATYAPGEATLLVRASTEADVVLGGELEALARRRGVRLELLTGPRRSAWSFLPEGYDGPATEVLLDLAPDLLASDVYLSGPPDWAATVRRVARAAGVARRDLHQEDFGW